MAFLGATFEIDFFNNLFFCVLSFHKNNFNSVTSNFCLFIELSPRKSFLITQK